MAETVNGLQKFLRAAKKLEETHVLRRVRDIDDIQKFDEQNEVQKTRQLHQQAALDRHAEKHKATLFAHPEYADGEWKQGKTLELEEILALEGLSAAAKRTASADELEQLAELQQICDDDAFRNLQELEAFQQFRLEEHHALEFKQLPAAAEEAFTGQFAEVAEAEMRREVEENRRALKEYEPPRLDLTPKKERVPAVPTEEQPSFTSVNDNERQQLDDVKTAEIVEENNEHTRPPRKSETVFYFRSTPNLPKE